MISSEYGKKIKEFRRARKMTQEEFAKEICSVQELQRIENKGLITSVYVFEKLLTKLNVDFSQSLYHFLSENSQKAHETIQEIDELIFDRNYYKTENAYRNFSTQSFYDEDDSMIRQFALYIDEVLLYELYHLPKEALETAYQAIQVTLPYFEIARIEKFHMVRREYLILNTMAILHFELGEKEKCVDILRQIKDSIYKNISFKETQYRLITTICYNLSKYLGLLEKYDEAILISNEGIEICLKAKTFKRLGELYCNKACALFYLNDRDGSQKSFQKSYSTFINTGDNKMADIVKKNAIAIYGIPVNES